MVMEFVPTPAQHTVTVELDRVLFIIVCVVLIEPGNAQGLHLMVDDDLRDGVTMIMLRAMGASG